MSVLRAVRRTALTLATVALAAAVATPAAASSTTTPAEIHDVVVEDGRVTFTVDAGALPDGAELDPGSVRVTSGGKVWPATGTAVEDSARTVPRRAVIAVDTSGSMGVGGIVDARAAANAFLDVVPADVSVGLVTFSDAARLAVEPTTDRQVVRAALEGMTPGGETTLYDGIAVALQALGSDGDRALVVLSDGEDTASTATFESVRDALAAAGVTAHLVAFRTEDAQIEVLRSLAAPAQGVVVETADGGELADVFASSARSLVNQVVVTADIPEGLTGEVADLKVEVSAGSSTAVAAASVPLPVPSAAPSERDQAGAPAPAAGRRSWTLPAVLAIAFVGLFLLFAVLLSPSTWRGDPSARRTRDVQRYTLTGGGNPAGAVAVSPSAVSQAALGWADRRVQHRGVEGSWQVLLDRAGLPLKAHEWLIIKLAAVLAGVAVAVLLLPWWLLTGPLTGLLGWLLAGAYLKFKARRRARKFAEELPDVLQLVAGSLSSGFSFPQAIDNAASEGQDPIAGELSRALAQSRLGVPLEDALEQVAGRMASADLSWTVMAVRISREVGGNLAEVLLSTAGTMRERGQVRRQVKALSAEGRLSGYILVGLPIAIALWMVGFRRAYVVPLVTEPLGIAMAAYAVISVAFGAWWMSRLVKLEV